MSEEDMNEQILFIEGDSKITVKNDQIFTNKTKTFEFDRVILLCMKKFYISYSYF